MKKKIVLGALLLLLLALLGWAFMPTPAIVEVAQVTQGRFERAVQEDGKTRLRERYAVSAPFTGRLARIALKQGDAVERDATVAMLWPGVPAMLDERARAEQVARSAAVQANVQRARANVERAGAAMEQARAELKRSETLAQQGFISPTQNEAGRLTVRLREKELESAKQDQVAARHELEQTRVSLTTPSPNMRTLGQRAFEVKAPVSGRVLKVLQQSEGTVLSGSVLMELGDPQALEVVVDLLTEDAAQVKPGTPVQLSNWGGPDVLNGKVRLVEPAAFTKISALGVEEQRVNAVIDITSPAEQWRTLGDGFKVDVRVLVQVLDNAVKVPVSALFPVGARSGLFVLDQDRARLREVTVEARNGAEALVKTGLAPGVEVIVYPDTKLKDGDRVNRR
jgi:HlyD family secretion protein